MKRVDHLEVVTVCVGYADFLAETAKWNAGLFDRWIIVTEDSDEATRELCRKMNLEVIITDDGKRHVRGENGINSGKFNKGRMVERGLLQTSDEGWRLHLDADIAVPHRFRHALEAADLQKDVIYGADRAMVQSFEDWKTLLDSGYMQGGHWDYHCRTQFPKNVQIGTRWAHPQMGYVPIGFFQLYHSSQDEWRGVRVKPYPMNHSNACRSDVKFGMKWDRHKRAVIPELFVVHLESHPAKMGSNWNGRTTKPFAPSDKSVEAEKKSLDDQKVLHRHVHHIKFPKLCPCHPYPFKE